MALSRAELLAGAVALAVFAGAAAADAAAAPAEKEGWLRSGRKMPIRGFSSGRIEAPQGRFENLAPAGGIRAVLASGDSIWIGAGNGLFVYLPAADTLIRDGGPGIISVSSLAAGENGELWVGGESGLSVRRAGGWRRFTARDHRFFSDITDVRLGEGRMWISTWGHGCGYVAADTLTVLTRADSLLDDRVTCVLEQSDRTIWIGTESGVCRADSFSWTSMRYGSRIPVGRIRDIIQTEEGDLFISVARQGVARYSLGRISNYGPGQGLPSRDIYRFGLDTEGRVWALGRSGVSIWDGSGWTPLRVPGVSLAAQDLLSLDHDFEGTAYLGASGGVMIAMARDSYREVRIPDYGPDSMIGSISRSGRSLLMTGRTAVYRLEDGEFTGISLPGRWFDGSLTGVVPQPRGGMWLSTRFGILNFSGGSWQVFDRRQGLPTENFTAVSPGREGDLWFGTFDRGVLRLTSGGWVHYGQQHGLPDDRVRSIIGDESGAMWVSTVSGDVARFTGGEWETIVLPGRAHETGATAQISDSLFTADPAVRILGRPDREYEGSFVPVLGLDGSGRCMVCVDSGIYFQSEAGWRVLEAPPGAIQSRPSSLKGTVSGGIWLGTEGSGAYVLSGGRWFQVDGTNGLGDGDVLSIEEDADGNIWIGTRSGGVTRYIP